jgi:uncharacterized cupredoxin-like copper-binding protein
MRIRRLAILLAVPLAAVGAIVLLTRPADVPVSIVTAQAAGPGAREITVTMTDAMRFEPADIRIRVGETVRLRVVNAGAIRHELVAGTEAQLDEHARIMAELGANHDTPGSAPHTHSSATMSMSLAPGEERLVEFRGAAAGTLSLGCFEPGHYEAGMRGSLVVE